MKMIPVVKAISALKLQVLSKAKNNIDMGKIRSTSWVSPGKPLASVPFVWGLHKTN